MTMRRWALAILSLLMAIAGWAQEPDSLEFEPLIPVTPQQYGQATAVTVDEFGMRGDSLDVFLADTLPVARQWQGYNVWEPRQVAFSPNPTRATPNPKADRATA